MELPLSSFLPVDLGDVLTMSPDQLIPGMPDDHPLLLRETPDGITQGKRIERARANLLRIVAGWRPGSADLADALSWSTRRSAPPVADWHSLGKSTDIRPSPTAIER